MSTIDKISDLLFNQLDSVYCDTCKFHILTTEEYVYCNTYSYYGCDGCIRKNMNWEISKSEATRLATLILKEFE